LRLVLATRNAHKLREFSRLLAGAVDLDALAEEVVLPPEEGSTFRANATVKAQAGGRAVGRACLADDSGIRAQALGGAPGVYSARFAGPHASDEQNLAKLLRDAPAGTPVSYECALVFFEPASDETRIFEGRCTGTLAEHPRGEAGFGYDPAFVPDEIDGGRTMAQLSDREKDAISHRGRAARAFLAWLAPSEG